MKSIQLLLLSLAFGHPQLRGHPKLFKRGGVGSECGSSHDCSDDYDCYKTTDTNFYKIDDHRDIPGSDTGICTDITSVGVGGMCSSSGQCADDYKCYAKSATTYVEVNDVFTKGSCVDVTSIPVGSDCNNSGQCSDDYKCYWNQGGQFKEVNDNNSLGQCTDVTSVPVGTICNNSGQCADDYKCYVNGNGKFAETNDNVTPGTCTDVTSVPVGTICNNSGQCADDYKCYVNGNGRFAETNDNTTPGVCTDVTSVPVGTICNNSGQCADDYKCYVNGNGKFTETNDNSTPGTCTDITSVPKDGPCNSSGQCADNLKCVLNANGQSSEVTDGSTAGICGNAPPPGLGPQPSGDNQSLGNSCNQDTDCGDTSYCAKFDAATPGVCRSKTCTSTTDCLSGLTCLGVVNGTAGVCGIADAAEDFFTSDLIQQQTRRLLVTDDTAWTEGDDRTVIREVLMAQTLAPLANDAYNNPPTSTIGKWNALTPQITADFRAVKVNWGWLSFTIYGDVPNHRYVIAFKGTDLTKINEMLTDLTGNLVPCKFGNTDCGLYHHGFHDAYDTLRLKLYQAVKDVNMPPSATIFITGHSLGGALASICALDLASGGINIRGVITFGSPRLGNPQFESVYNNVMTQRGALQARFAAVDSGKKNQDAVTMLAPLPVKVPFVGDVGFPYSRPVNNVIVGASPACDKLSLGLVFPCEIRLHFMESSYVPMIQALYDVAIKKIQ